MSGTGSALEVFLVFLKLGLTSFGGPIAHLGYFRDELVLRRKWIDDEGYAELVALCQFLPGPTSSQVGFSLGVLRGGGLRGGTAAWLGFTLPSALFLTLCAFGAVAISGPAVNGLIHGLKLVAVAIIAQAVWGMAKTLTPDRTRAGIALASMATVVFFAGTWGQITAIFLGALAGLMFCHEQAPSARPDHSFPISRGAGILALILFVALLFAPALVEPITSIPGVKLFDAFYRSGALVFGGGHVMLPLLQEEVVSTGWISQEAFLTGYGLTQAVPGPLFTFAAYLGTAMNGAPNGFTGAMIALVAIFLPGILLAYGVLPFGTALRRLKGAQAAMAGANASVVGILGAALYEPVWTSAVLAPSDFVLALTGFLLLTLWHIPPWIVVLLLACAGLGLGVI